MPEPDPPAAIQTPSGATPASNGAPGEAPPFPVPDHTLIRRVGRGAYGEVWLAHNTLGTWRAVKFIRRSSFDDDRPFERELAGIQRFEPISRSHESQLNILHVGRADDGFYYVMELADDMSGAFASGGTSAASPQSLSPELELESGPRGTRPSEKRPAETLNPDTYTPRNLRTELHLRGRLPAAECLRIGLALTTALGHLHKHGLVHRDIKPSNIVFVNGIPKLADIGLVARAEATISFVGTEGFLPPEGPGTRQADIYSLGKVLYEISTGHDRQQFPELPTNIVELPDRAELSELNEVLLKACHSDPKERYQTAAEMHADLALLESGRSVVRLRGLERQLRFVQRAGAVVTVIAGLAAGLYFWQAQQTRQVRELAEQNQKIAEEKTLLAAEKSSLAEANREQLVRLDIANGVRLMDAGDLSGSRIKFKESGGESGARFLPGIDLTGSLLWFSDALPHVAHLPLEDEIHRIRIQSVLSVVPRLLQVVAHAEGVEAGTFSPDGRYIASGSRDGELRVWDAQTAQPVFPPLLLGNGIRSLRFSRDGRRLVVRSTSDTGRAIMKDDKGFALVLNASTGVPIFERITNVIKTAYSRDDQWLAVARSNFTIQLFEASTGRLVKELVGHTNVITSLAFSTDSSRLLTASDDFTARTWRIPSGELEGPPLRHEGVIWRAVISPDGRRVVTVARPVAGDDVGQICVWDPRSGELIGTPLKEKGAATGLWFDTSDGHRLFTTDSKLRLRVWDPDTQTEILPALPTRSSEVHGWSLSPDGTRLAIGSADNDVYVWSLKTGELLLPPLRHNGWAEVVEFSPDGNRLLTSGADGCVKVWDLGLQADQEPSMRLESPIVGATLSEDGEQLLAALRDGSIRRVNLATLHEEPQRMPARQDRNPLRSLAFDRSGRQWAATLATSEGNDNSHSVRMWRQQNDQISHLDLPHPRAAFIVTFDPTGSQLITVDNEGSIRSWNTADGTLAREISLPDRNPILADVSPDARTVALALGRPGERPRDLRLVDLETAQPVGAIIRDEEGISNFAFSPDSKRLAIVGGRWGSILDAVSGKPLTPRFKPGCPQTSLSWSQDGQRVISAGLADFAMIWDATSGALLLPPMWSAYSRQAHFSHDGRFVVEWGLDRHVRLWDATTAEVLTPRWQQDGDLWIVRVTPGGRLIVVSGDTIRLWNLKPNSLPAGIIADYSRLLAGRRLNAAGVIQPIPSAELAALCRSLRIRAPQLFE